MLPHSSHLLQPLNVSYFSPLKRVYSTKIIILARRFIIYIAKLDFLIAFKTAYLKTFIVKGIKGAFRGAGLVPHDLDTVISRLDVRLRTPNQPP
jgi:hypothetical protein